MLGTVPRVRLPIARRLERATPSEDAFFTNALGRALVRSLARPLRLPHGVPVVCVGGATLGGSGKTRVAVACTQALASAGARVVLVGHAYRAKPRVARVVHRADRVEDVGDEALVCARALGGGAPVVVAPTRQQALDLAARARPDAIVVDGPLQARPVRATLAILAVDAASPWGSGALFPTGDLRAPSADLVAHADLVVPVDATPEAFLIDGERIAPQKLGGLRVGLFTAIARPDRFSSALSRIGLHVDTTVEVPDHGPVDDTARRVLAATKVDAWIATPKCAVHLEGASLSAPLLVAEGSVTLPAAWERRLHLAGGVT